MWGTDLTGESETRKEGNFSYKQEYPFEYLQDCELLLNRCLVVLNDLPDTPVKGSRGLTTYKIAQQITELLKK